MNGTSASLPSLRAPQAYEPAFNRCVDYGPTLVEQAVGSCSMNLVTVLRFSSTLIARRTSRSAGGPGREPLS